MLLHLNCWRALTLLALTLPVSITSSQRQHRRGVPATSAILPAHIVLRSDSPNNYDGGRSDRRWRGRSGSGGGGRGSRRKWSKMLRPSPDDDGLPVLPLDVGTGADRQMGPTSRDLEPRTLMSLLGEEFDIEFMAIARPTDSMAHPNGTYLYDASAAINRGFAVRLPRLRGFRIPGSPDSVGRVAIKGRAARRRAQRYLAAYSYCPVFARWRDLGRRFWPRWIREGSCRDEQRGRSCSMPPGMTCRPHRSATKTVLWWHCRTSSRGRPAQSTSALASTPSCGWIPIKYPIITACKCSC